MSKLVEQFNDFSKMYPEYFKEIEGNLINVQGGITFSEGASCFNLNKPCIAQIADEEVIKRIILTEDVLNKIVHNDILGSKFLKEVEKEFTSLGCVNFTFLMPDEKVCRLCENENSIEVRAYGYRLKSEIFIKKNKK
jgi:hypothetical protein